MPPDVAALLEVPNMNAVMTRPETPDYQEVGEPPTAAEIAKVKLYGLVDFDIDLSASLEGGYEGDDKHPQTPMELWVQAVHSVELENPYRIAFGALLDKIVEVDVHFGGERSQSVDRILAMLQREVETFKARMAAHGRADLLRQLEDEIAKERFE